MSDLKLDSFQILLKGFNETIKDYPSIESVKDTLEDLKRESVIDNTLTEHQKSAIIARCDNYLSNQYGDQRKSQDTRSDFQKKLS